MFLVTLKKISFVLYFTQGYSKQYWHMFSMLLSFHTRTVYLKHDFEFMLQQNNVGLELSYQIEAAGSTVTYVIVFSFACCHRTWDNDDLNVGVQATKGKWSSLCLRHTTFTREGKGI